MENIKKSVGRRAEEIRKRLGYRNRETFAEVLGVHSNTVGFLERGESWISAEMLMAYSRLGVSPAEFFADRVVRVRPGPREAWQIVGEFIDAELSKKKTTE